MCFFTHQNFYYYLYKKRRKEKEKASQALVFQSRKNTTFKYKKSSHIVRRNFCAIRLHQQLSVCIFLYISKMRAFLSSLYNRNAISMCTFCVQFYLFPFKSNWFYNWLENRFVSSPVLLFKITKKKKNKIQN